MDRVRTGRTRGQSKTDSNIKNAARVNKYNFLILYNIHFYFIFQKSTIFLRKNFQFF
jgi:hypothetical protein